jgi:sugar O-acyltransferase (sialic acid O-acetyltransferase NeuD family)
MKERVIIWGAGGHARVVADILRLTGFDVAGFIDEVNPSRRGESFCGAMVLGGAAELEAFPAQGVRKVIVAFGDNARRVALGNHLESAGFELIAAIHPSAVIAGDVRIGAGSVIMAGSVINTNTAIGRQVIVNTRAGIDHDCYLAEGVHVGPGANIAGDVRIGRCTWIGIGATIIDHKQSGAGSVVGAGAVVLKDVPEGVVVVGVPARTLKQNLGSIK